MAEIVRITEADDPRLAQYRHIRERDLVGRDRTFIAEGAVVLRVLLTGSRHRPISVLVAEKRLPAVEPLLEQVSGLPLYVASQDILERIAGFPLHRGILALGRCAPAPPAEELLADRGGRSTIIALFGVANHDNVGGIFRNAAAFGADAVLLDSACCDPLYRKAIRVSVGASLMLPFARLPNGTDILGLLAAHGFQAIGLSPTGAMPLAQMKPPRRAALLLGAEGHGLPPDVLSGALGVRIPMAAGFDSLNVATASGIVLHHLAFGKEGEC